MTWDNGWLAILAAHSVARPKNMKQNTIVTHIEHGLGKVIGYSGKTARAVRFPGQTIICPLSSLTHAPQPPTIHATKRK